MDLLLDRAPVAAKNGKAGTFYAVPAGATVQEQRVRGVQKVLQLLDALPAAEPPKDLVAKTLSRVRNGSANGRRARLATPHPIIHLDNRPMA